MHTLETQRVDNVMAFSVLWTLRLTFNYWRRGGYQIGSEDYRWNLIKGWIGTPAFFLLNVFFTSSVQSVLLFAVTAPTYILLLASRLYPAMTTVEYVFARFLIVLIVVEWFADGQQWNFHAAKAAYQRTAKPQPGYSRAQLDRGFNTLDCGSSRATPTSPPSRPSGLLSMSGLRTLLAVGGIGLLPVRSHT